MAYPQNCATCGGQIFDAQYIVDAMKMQAYHLPCVAIVEGKVLPKESESDKKLKAFEEAVTDSIARIDVRLSKVEGDVIDHDAQLEGLDEKLDEMDRALERMVTDLGKATTQGLDLIRNHASTVSDRRDENCDVAASQPLSTEDVTIVEGGPQGLLDMMAPWAWIYHRSKPRDIEIRDDGAWFRVIFESVEIEPIDYASLPYDHPIRRWCRGWDIQNPKTQDQLCELISDLGGRVDAA